MTKQKALHCLNLLYSMVWIKLTGKDKYAYREESKVHAAILKWMCPST